MISLPIDAVLPALRQALEKRDEAVLEAPPGAGKTTRVPLALLNEPWLAGQTILMLEPRRLAARAAAERLASELGEQVGETVGYRIRLDSKVGPKTRIEVVTEGILTRRLQADPALEGVGLLIFDEFHVLLNAQEITFSCQKASHVSPQALVVASRWSRVGAIAHYSISLAAKRNADRIHSGILQARSFISSSPFSALTILETTLADSPSFPM